MISKYRDSRITAAWNACVYITFWSLCHNIHHIVAGCNEQLLTEKNCTRRHCKSQLQLALKLNIPEVIVNIYIVYFSGKKNILLLKKTGWILVSHLAFPSPENSEAATIMFF